MSSPRPDEPNATYFTLLGSHGSVDDDRLYGLYAYPADGTRCVRGNMIISLDGAASTDGTSGGLGGPGDRRLFKLLRELADVIVVGAGTARAENYSGAQMTVAQRRNRRQRGQAEIPPIALVTRSAHLDRDLAVLTRTEVAPLVLTSAGAAEQAAAQLGSAAEVLSCSADDPAEVDPAITLATLADRGQPRILCEGGPRLMGTFLSAGLLDEMCLTTAPVMVGGNGPRITAGSGQVLIRMARAHLMSDADGYLYGRYTRAR